MDIGNEGRLAEIEFIEAALKGDTFAVDHRAHCPIAEEGPRIEFLQK
jgi:hypothetical protein